MIPLCRTGSFTSPYLCRAPSTWLVRHWNFSTETFEHYVMINMLKVMQFPAIIIADKLNQKLGCYVLWQPTFWINSHTPCMDNCNWLCIFELQQLSLMSCTKSSAMSSALLCGINGNDNGRMTMWTWTTSSYEKFACKHSSKRWLLSTWPLKHRLTPRCWY